MARAAELARTEVARGATGRLGVHVGAVARAAQEQSRLEAVARVGDPGQAALILGPGEERASGEERGPGGVALVASRWTSRVDGHSADGRVARCAGDAFERRGRQQVPCGRTRPRASSGAPGGHGRLQVLPRGMAVDAPALPTGSRHGQTRTRLDTGVDAARSQYPGPGGTRHVTPHLLLDQALERSDERAAYGERHRRPAPLRHLARMTRGTILRARSGEVRLAYSRYARRRGRRGREQDAQGKHRRAERGRERSDDAPGGVLAAHGSRPWSRQVLTPRWLGRSLGPGDSQAQHVSRQPRDEGEHEDQRDGDEGGDLTRSRRSLDRDRSCRRASPGTLSARRGASRPSWPAQCGSGRAAAPPPTRTERASPLPPRRWRDARRALFSSIRKSTCSTPAGNVERTSSGSSGAACVHCWLSSSRGDDERNGAAPERHS